ncbi:MAG TPA: hypothetical protein VMW49_07070, partial [Candidatus Dormibacteraeota bacterium]|nr:hypothetical protein [Candidatus Dormibacteraeota bacterium]
PVSRSTIRRMHRNNKRYLPGGSLGRLLSPVPITAYVLIRALGTRAAPSSIRRRDITDAATPIAED